MEDEKELDQNLKDQEENHNLDDNQNDDDEDQNRDEGDQNNDDGDDGEETIESLKAKLAKTQQAYENQKKRAEKAESRKSEDGKDNKKVEQPKKISKSDELSPKDLYALMENKVPKDDIDDVVQYAKFSKISVEQALETDFVTRLLADKAEKRATARATNIGASRRGAGKPSGSSLLNNAITKGEIPDDDEDLDRMIDARLEHKKKQISNKR